MREYMVVYQEDGKMCLAQNVYREDADYNGFERQVISLDFDQVGEVYSYIVKHYINDIFLKELDNNA